MPISAGSNPGPVCYGRGGVQPAVTDANLVLGHLDKEHFLDGRMELDEEKARQAFSEYGKKHGLSAEAAAEGVLDISNHKMADAIRQITVQRGIDPRGFSMLAFGGAGPMHAALIAEELDIREVLIPQLPGAFSAWGMLQADVHHDGVRTVQKELAEIADRELGMLEEELHSELTEILETEDFEKKDIIFQKALEMRYVGQSYAINVDIPEGDMRTCNDRGKIPCPVLKTLRTLFRKGPVEVVNLRVRAVVPTEKIKVTVSYEEGTKAEPVKTLRGIFKGKEYDTAVYKRDQIVPGQHLPGTGCDRRTDGYNCSAAELGYFSKCSESGSSYIYEGRGRRKMSAKKVSPVMVEIIRNAFISIAEEMNASMLRSAYSPLIYESKDCSVGIFDKHARLLGQAAGLPIFLGNLGTCIEILTDKVGLENYKPGDVYMMNDSYLQGTHLTDITVIAPIFYKEELIGFSASRADGGHIGGKDLGPSSDSTNICPGRCPDPTGASGNRWCGK